MSGQPKFGQPMPGQPISGAGTSGSGRAPLVEVFWSIQGEGRFVGQPMAFVRVATCPIRCSYCDTDYSYRAPAKVPVRLGSGEHLEPNPVEAARAAALAAHVTPDHDRGAAVSVTGGEPLVFPGFVAGLGQALRAAGRPLHLETAALDPAALRRCIGAVDHLSADYKLPETLGGDDHGDAHVACCELAAATDCTIDVKMVLVPAVGEASLARALDRLSPLRRRVLLVLQPVTPCLRETVPLAPEKLAAAVRAGRERGFDLRVLPQVHKVLRVP